MAKTPSTPVQEAPAESPQHTKGRAILQEIVDLYINTYPTFRPNFTDCSLIATLVYSVSVKHDISPGQRKLLELLRKKLVNKGVIQEAPCK